MSEGNSAQSQRPPRLSLSRRCPRPEAEKSCGASSKPRRPAKTLETYRRWKGSAVERVLGDLCGCSLRSLRFKVWAFHHRRLKIADCRFSTNLKSEIPKLRPASRRSLEAHHAARWQAQA